MATRKPLVIIAGRIRELPAGDSIGVAAGEEEVYSKRIDFINDNLLYKGEASVGALDTALAWRIRKIEIGPDGDVTETFADGNAQFDNAWTDRLIKVYS